MSISTQKIFQLKMKTFRITFLVLYIILTTSVTAQLKPDIVNLKYGPSDRNTLDFWKAKSETPTPLIVYFHGGGFNSGTKEKVSDGLKNKLLENGLSFMSVEYRLTPEVAFPQHYMDCARAIQFVRFHCKELNIDPHRIGATGSSAGGCIALWLGFHDDLKDTTNSDSVLQQSTRLKCIAVFSAQSTLDPIEIKNWFGDLALKHSMFKGAFLGLSPKEANTENAEDLYIKASPVTYLTVDDPPVWAYYSRPNVKPESMSDAVHHPRFGEYLKIKMDSLGVKCELRLQKDSMSVTNDCVKFFSNQFNLK
jgi:acetyl esterase